MARQYPSWYTGPRIDSRRYQRDAKYRKDFTQLGIDYREWGGRTRDRALHADRMRAQMREERRRQNPGRPTMQRLIGKQRYARRGSTPPGPGRFKATPYTPGSGRRVRSSSYQPRWKPVRLPGFAQQRSPSASRRHINRLNPLSSRRGRGGGGTRV